MNEYLEPQEEKFTTWFNPLTVEQRVLIHIGDDPRPTKFTVAPGQRKQIPSRYDYAIHRVENGVIIGGLAPQLVKEGSDEKLDPALDTEGAKRREAEATIRAAAMQQKMAQQAIVMAAASVADADEAIGARAPAPAPPPPPVDVDEPQGSLPGTPSRAKGR